MKRAKILYDRLVSNGKAHELFDKMNTCCPSHYGLSEFSRCRFKTENLADPYECLQCWMCKEREEE